MEVENNENKTKMKQNLFFYKYMYIVKQRQNIHNEKIREESKQKGMVRSAECAVIHAFHLHHSDQIPPAQIKNNVRECSADGCRLGPMYTDKKENGKR